MCREKFNSLKETIPPVLLLNVKETLLELAVRVKDDDTIFDEKEAFFRK